MNLLIAPFIVLGLLLSGTASSQEKFGSTFNLGVGLGGYGGNYRYDGHKLPVLYLGYEFDAAKDLTLAPFIGFYSYNDSFNEPIGTSYEGIGNTYGYRQTIIPVGIKSTYYFDDLLNLNSNWDFYGALSAGHIIARAKWADQYPGKRNYYRGNSLYLNVHLGSEYHINHKLGAFLDVSNGFYTVGLALHYPD